VVELETRILAKNDALAAKNRAWFAGREIRARNDGERILAAGAGRAGQYRHGVPS
jgi:hydrogenase nickel incorporation protein HypB